MMQSDSVAQTATLTTLALFLSSGLTGVEGAPTAFEPSSSSSSYSSSSLLGQVEMMDPLRYPCGRPVSAAQKSLKRHHAHNSLKDVHRQLKIAKINFFEEFRILKKLYLNKSKAFDGQYTMSWLPQNQRDWYHREARCLNKSEKANVVLPKLQEALQRFTMTFYHLRNYKLFTDRAVDEMERKRYKSLDNMYKNARQVLCEVNSAMENLDMALPPVHTESIVTGQLGWKTSGDSTAMLIQDNGVLRLYRSFLNDWVGALRHATLAGEGSCDPSKPMIGGNIKAKGKRKPTRKKAKKEGGRSSSGKANRFPNGRRRANRPRNSRLLTRGGPRGRLTGNEQETLL